MNLRKYQIEAIDAIKHQWSEGFKKTLLVLPTGTGKTIVFSNVVADETKDGSHALILAHRGELLDQAADKLKMACGLDSALEKAESSSIGSPCNITIGSIQTLCQEKRMHEFPHDYFKTIVVDEAHHVLSPSYQKVLSYFDTANILGVTATADRGDQKNLGQFFDSKAYEYSMAQAIKEGYLSPVKAQMIPLELDINSVGMSNGDYAVGDIGSALEPYLNQIALEMVKYCKGRKTLVFLPLIKTSQKFCELLNMHGLKAAEVNGESDDRAEVLEDYRNSEYEVLCNSMLLTEGFDLPAIDCIVVLRPTKVRALYQQMVGRGMRLSPETGKKDLLLLDFLWMTERHDLCRPSALISKDAKMAERIDKKMMDSASGIDLMEAEDEVVKDALKEREESLARELAAMRKKQRKLVDPIQYSISIAAEDLVDYEPMFAWQAGPATEKQIKYLEKLGISSEAITNCGMASLLIDKLNARMEANLATPKQIRFLEGKGFLHVGLWSFDDASKMITRISNNGWCVPFGVDAPNYRP